MPTGHLEASTPWERVGWPLRYPPLKRLFEFWVDKRGARACPDYAELDPFELAAILPDLIVMDAAEDGLDASYQFVGQRVTALIGGGFKGKRRREVLRWQNDRIDREAQRRLDNEYAWVARSLNGAVRVMALRDIGRPKTRIARITLPFTAGNGRAEHLVEAIASHIILDPATPFVEEGFAINSKTLQPMELPLDCAVRMA